jgi:hypothetical protein
MLIGRFLAEEPAALRDALSHLLLVMTGGFLPHSFDRRRFAGEANSAIEPAVDSMPDWSGRRLREMDIESDTA